MSSFNFRSKRFILAVGSVFLVIAAWCFFSYFVFGSIKPVTRTPQECKEIERQIDAAGKGGKLPEQSQQLDKLNIICAIKKADFWYSTNAKINQVLYSYGTLAVIVLSFLTAMFIGADVSKRSEGWRILTLSLPLLSTAIAAVTAQFHFQESWVLRENGRIKAEYLLSRAEALPTDPAAFATRLKELRDDLLELEEEQAIKYFAYRFRNAKDGDAHGIGDENNN